MVSYSIVLFYVYVDVVDENGLIQWISEREGDLGLTGRVVVASEGVNGNLASQNGEQLRQFCHELERKLGLAPGTIDLKFDASDQKPFPDLVLKKKKEICSTGNHVSKRLLDEGLGGKHLSPKEFHEALQSASNDEIELIDVRNNIEYNIGHFEEAVNPGTKEFSQWVPEFADKNLEKLKGKSKVLMYCTGGIRCEKASAYLRSKGVKNVCQLSGGIHRYLEEFGSNGLFHGSNFVFDSRVLQKPEGSYVIGRCFNCKTAETDAISSDRVCSVCREPVLVCDSCRSSLLGTYFCEKHSVLQGHFQPFFSRFSVEELLRQLDSLQEIWKDMKPRSAIRKSVSKHIQRVTTHLQQRQELAKVDDDSLSTKTRKELRKNMRALEKWGSLPRCRSCGLQGPRPLLRLLNEPLRDEDLTCDGKCVGMQREAYEDPKRPLEFLNSFDFEQILRLNLAKKRKADEATTRTRVTSNKKRKLDMFTQELEKTEYVLKKDVDPPVRAVKPYFFNHKSRVKKRWLGLTVLEMFMQEFSSREESFNREAIKQGLVTVNGKEVDLTYKLSFQDEIEHLVHRHEPDVNYVPAESMIADEDENFLVVDKPASLTVHPSGAFRKNSLTFILGAEKNLIDLYPIHRLDRLTSGLVIFAKSKDCAAEVQHAMTRKIGGKGFSIKKAYLARVHGQFKVTEDFVQSKMQELLGDIEEIEFLCNEESEMDQYLQLSEVRKTGLYIDRDGAGMMDLSNEFIDLEKPAMIVSWPLRCRDPSNGMWEAVAVDEMEKVVDAKPSMSIFRILKYDEASDTTLLQCEPVTGRTHQLRLHLKLLGHPILRDRRYGFGKSLGDVRNVQNDPPVIEDAETLSKEELAQKFCVTCTQGIEMAFKPIQLLREGICLHAYRYRIHLSGREPIEKCVKKLPDFAAC